jgi:hypothetical protein
MLRKGMFLRILGVKAIRARHPTYSFLRHGQTFQVSDIGYASMTCALRIPGCKPRENFELSLKDLLSCVRVRVHAAEPL